MTTGTLILLCTCPNDEIAAGLARTLVEENLAACVSRVANVASVYKWEGVVQEDAEIQLIIKTSDTACDRLIARLTDLHPYELPEVITVPIVAGHEPYLDWIKKTTA